MLFDSVLLQCSKQKLLVMTVTVVVESVSGKRLIFCISPQLNKVSMIIRWCCVMSPGENMAAVILTVLCGKKNLCRSLQLEAPPPGFPFLSANQGQSQRVPHRKKSSRTEKLTVPSWGKMLKETGIIRPKTSMALTWRQGAASMGFLWKSRVLWRKAQCWWWQEQTFTHKEDFYEDLPL